MVIGNNDNYFIPKIANMITPEVVLQLLSLVNDMIFSNQVQ